MNGQMFSPAAAGDHQSEVFSVWKRHITSLAQSGGIAKDIYASFDRRGARPGYVRCQEEVRLVAFVRKIRRMWFTQAIHGTEYDTKTQS